MDKDSAILALKIALRWGLDITVVLILIEFTILFLCVVDIKLLDGWLYGRIRGIALGAFLWSLRVEVEGKRSLEQILAKMGENLERDMMAELELDLGGGVALTGRAAGKRPRRKLPKDWMNGQRHSNTNLECGGATNLAEEGWVRFVMNSMQKDCYHAFVGSRRLKCTAALLCHGVVQLMSSGSTECEDQYLYIRDGTTGKMRGCEEFNFEGMPRTASINGTDLYINYQGRSVDSPCTVFCIEGVSHPDMKPARRIARSKEFKGFPAEGSCTCGKRRDFGRVVGGEAAKKFEFPWMAALVCAGTLISDRHVITAAHCFTGGEDNPDSFQILLHAHVLDKTPSEGRFTHDQMSWTPGWNLPKETDFSEKSVRVDVAEIRMHPLFISPSNPYDVAVLKLKKAVNFKRGKVSPICLPYMQETIPFKDGDTMVLAGWGRASEKAKAATRLLQRLEVPYINHRKCLELVPGSHTHLCAGYLEGGKDACLGDSGGPLIYQFDKRRDLYMLSGIVSAGIGCARPTMPGLYTDVQEVIQWIYHQVSEDEDVLWCDR